MKLWSRLTLTAAIAVILCSSFGIVFKAAPQGRGVAPAQAPTGTRKAGEYFKNVTTSTLKELTVDDFIGAMGVMTAGLGYDCADCHPNAGSDKADFVADTIPQKRTARRMIEMVAAINRDHFGGAQRVTCFTCHRNQETPKTTIALDNLYSAPPMEDDDVVLPAVGGPTADQILDKYIQAVGGAQRLASLTSFVATGTSNGYGGFGGEADFTIFAKAPNQRTTLISFKDHPERGDSVWAFDGTTGWIKTPRGLLTDYQLVGEELDGERLEAQMAFPGQLKQALNNWRTGLRRAIDGKDYLVVQGRGPRNLLATLYFDQNTGLLRRLVRYGPSPVGRVPTQIDYTDYRDVGGIKFPFEYQFSWLDGRYSAKIKDIKTNVAIDAARFARPAAK
jgi:photosynthetic reaction center cytochrome c subunit